jgi:hypothetical protein
MIASEPVLPRLKIIARCNQEIDEWAIHVNQREYDRIWRSEKLIRSVRQCFCRVCSNIEPLDPIGWKFGASWKVPVAGKVAETAS